MTSVPPLRSDSYGEPPPWYSGDQPTVPNPVYRDPAVGGQGSGRSPGGRSANGSDGAGRAPVAGSPEPSEKGTEPENPEKKDDVGRRGNLVMGGMLVAGLVVVGAAFAMVSDTVPGPGDGAETAAADGDEGPALAAATPGDGDGEAADDPAGSGGGDEAVDGGSEDAAVTSAADLPEPAAFGETVRVLDGVTVATSETRAFDPAGVSDATVDEYLAVDVTVVNGAGEEVGMLPVVHLVDDLAEIEPYLEGAELEATGHPRVTEEASGVDETWSGADMELGSTAFGTFGFGLLAGAGEAPAGPFLVVWVDSGDGLPVPVAFGDT